MKAELQGSSYSVALDESDVESFARLWPCYGERRPLVFQFDARNGDLIDLEGDDSDNDERGVVVLSNEAGLAGAVVLKLDSVLGLRWPLYMAESGAMSAREAADYAPQWGSLIRSGDPGAVMYCRLEEAPAAALAYVQTHCLPIADSGDSGDWRDVLEVRRLAAYLKSLT